MFFLLRAAFWLSIVIMLLPSNAPQPKSGPQVSASEALSAAGAAVTDLRHFCARQPEACAVGSQAAVAFGQKAQVGAKMLYEFISEQLGPNETGSVAEDTSMRAVPAAMPRSQDTLTPTDLAPAWRGSAPRREASVRRPA